ncbi:hypothetical protein MJ588_15545 [Klebsiella pneumoniae]|nr:hypothetical protein MJ588_15545 [Klebsiella pneumoniae]
MLWTLASGGWLAKDIAEGEKLVGRSVATGRSNWKIGARGILATDLRHTRAIVGSG